ncbi:sulfonate ABC transporter ATP-binding protein [Rhodoblastus sphagnicola]|uniref:Sulfonate ABC transporter ATP-binding protein n=2 Tax=Rhodoblastus sphagnicola TaxID=333368 RepID=A0A2S6MU25_9HYPH|nr:ABC transporter ATP-binding protein [Rhodoblastus sphagnicola]PPQ25870.1 sulfonate ABC transporter ATP-binding protein [Rhodoblastus sphagnicola]
MLALSGVDLHVDEGEFVSIVGASGCGKSTLLRLILGLDTDYEGEVRIDGVRVKTPGLDRAIVFQDHRLLPWLNVRSNIAVALRHSPLGKAEKAERVDAQMRLVGLERFSDAYPAQLSGGMAQRVAIARALVNRPRFLLLDEPLGALDALTRLRLQNELLRIVRQEGATAILVTHDVDEAVYLGDRVVVMRPDPGRVATVLSVSGPQTHDRSSPGFIGLRDQVLALLGVAYNGAELSLAREADAREAAPA